MDAKFYIVQDCNRMVHDESYRQKLIEWENKVRHMIKVDGFFVRSDIVNLNNKRLMLDVGIILCAIEVKKEFYDEDKGECNIHADDFIFVECNITDPDAGVNKMIKEVENYEKAKNKNNTIKAHDGNIRDIVNQEIKKYGLKADLNHIDVSEVTNMDLLFEGSYFNGDISEWDVSNVTNMAFMFNESEFNGDISKWDVSTATEMFKMFENCPIEDHNKPKSMQNKSVKSQEAGISDVLNEREQTHGDFAENARMAQSLRNVIAEAKNYESLSDVQKEAIHNIVSKLSRILCGDADHEDNWIDIAGYSTLVVNELNKGK